MSSSSLPNYYLLIYIEDQSLRAMYQDHINAHKNKLNNQGKYGDSGFDLLVPEDITSPRTTCEPIKIDMKVSIAMFRSGLECPCGYYLYPRSSLYKNGLRLTNSVGIIDSGYRGHLAGFFDVVRDTTIPQYSRLLQLCTPDLSPIYNIVLVESLEDLGSTARGVGGFGSTGF